LGEAGGDGEGISGESACLIHGAIWGEVVHDFGATAEGADGEAAADDLSEGGEIGDDAAEFLVAAAGEAEAGHDFVEDEDGIVSGAEFAEGFEEAWFGEVKASVGGDGFDDDRGDFVAAGMEEGAESWFVVVRESDGEGGEIGGNACAVWGTVSEGAATGFDEEGIDMAMIAAFEFEDEVAFGEATGEADAGHGGFGAAVDHPDFLDGGDPIANRLGDGDFAEVRDAEADAAGGGFVDGGADDGRSVAEDGGAPGAEVVDEFVAIDVPDMGTGGAFDEEGGPADAAESADWGIDSAGDELACFVEGDGGLREGEHWEKRASEN